MHNKLLIFILSVLAVALVACGGSDVAEEALAEQKIVVDMQDIFYGPNNDNVQNPPEWMVSSGAEVTVSMENMGALEHSWVILKQGEAVPTAYDEAVDGDKVLFSSGNVAAGTGDDLVFTAPAPGEYNVLCTVPGHSAVMQGRLIVTE